MWIEQTVDRESQQKLYVQIYTIIKGKIEKEEWPAGTQIPTEDELCRTYNISKATVRIAISELAREGYLKRQQGKGTFVTYSMPNLGMAMKTRFTEDMFEKEVRADKEILFRGIGEPPPEARSYLKTGDKIYYILCRRMVSGEPAYLEASYISYEMLPDVEELDIAKGSLYSILQEKGIKKIFKVIQTVEVSKAGGEDARNLDAEEGQPVLVVHRLLLSSDNTPVAYTKFIGRSDKYKFQTEFERIR